MLFKGLLPLIPNGADNCPVFPVKSQLHFVCIGVSLMTASILAKAWIGYSTQRFNNG